ncbi:hypothetical protein [Tolypothrix sp. NIES-4075]|uniref:hypothetical protein n=1 Tax=Tolypothrix sp. NIES-4075 TaxID=2005459 RepID=UPI0013579230|nr:hypothetical protein [Tolypothrix sp. NIES-4075]
MSDWRTPKGGMGNGEWGMGNGEWVMVRKSEKGRVSLSCHAYATRERAGSGSRVGVMGNWALVIILSFPQS